MAEPIVPDAVREAFADLTGALEDAALIASRGQSIQTPDGARQCADELEANIEQMLARLRQLRMSVG